MPWQAGEQPLQRDQQPLVRAGSVHAAGYRHHPKIHLRQDCWWVLTDLSITWMYVKRDVNVAIYFARRKEQLRYQTKLESIDLKATVLQCLAKTLTKMKLRTTRVAKYIISDNQGLDCFFSTHFPGHESQNLEFSLRPNFGQDHPPLVENVLVAIFFIKKPLQGKSLVEIDFKWQSHRDQSNAIFHLSLRHKGDLCPQGGEVFRGSWMRGEIGKLFIAPFISTSQT